MGQSRLNEDGWLPVADLMAGVMMAFVLVAVMALSDLEPSGKSSKTPLSTGISELHSAIAESMREAFGEQLQLWDAKLDGKTLSIDFGAPEINFKSGSTELNRRYKVILRDFFPRYIKALMPHKDLIEEVRIEGHASTDWTEGANAADAWFENMALSQDRTRAVLQFVYGLPGLEPHQTWMRERMVAVGLSSARVIRNDDGSENPERSRRVSFRLVTRESPQK